MEQRTAFGLILYSVGIRGAEAEIRVCRVSRDTAGTRQLQGTYTADTSQPRDSTVTSRSNAIGKKLYENSDTSVRSKSSGVYLSTSR